MNFSHPIYFLCVILGVTLALAFPATRHLARSERRQYYTLQFIMLIGAVLGAKLSVLFGDFGWPVLPLQDWKTVLWSGRSITGALLLGFLFAEVAKPFLKYEQPPNDRFAAVLPFSIALGRVGCLMEGCCAGVPYEGICAYHGLDGTLRFPSQALEIAFQLTIGLSFLFMAKRKILHGHLFALYLGFYGLFRFSTEFMRDTPKAFAGWSGYQWLSLIMIALGTGFFLKRYLARPTSWDESISV
ncbi:prolipoprotein diacylglyceryl transferase [soil metagenome]